RPRGRRAALAPLVGAEREPAPHRMAHRRARPRRHGDPERRQRRAARPDQGVLRLRRRSAPSGPRSGPAALPGLVDHGGPGPLSPVVRSRANFEAMRWGRHARWVVACGAILAGSAVLVPAHAGTGSETPDNPSSADTEPSRIAAAGHSL